ncbi:hypothetical protein [Natrinema sp. 1APR25-10V2]|uniref:DUF6414 family protein n=1 Tax=Natrinema sp. 1APR25-10V2 TaxID=2951081 RepID=UPI00287BBCF5|nr:hypothetical protein [Natrinema sp. 1APR25-10V2]
MISFGLLKQQVNDMGVIDWIKSRFSEESDDDPEPLREFIYLDETSVVSLLASLEGEITESLITRSESVNRELGKSNKGLSYKGTGYNRINESETLERSGSETIQRSVIQSRFDELYESRQNQLLLPSEEGLEVEEVTRSEIIELDGYVNVAESYRVFKILEYLTNTFEDIEELQESIEDIPREELDAVSGFLSSLFGNQVPVKIDAANYRIVEGHIQHIHNLDSAEEGKPISIVAYLNRDSLWDDPLTVFSDNTEFTIYGRVISNEVDWTPLRLTRVLEDHFPDQARQVNMALKTALLNLEKEGGKSEVSIDVEKNLEELLSDLQSGLETRGYSLEDSDLTTFASDDVTADSEFEDYTEARDEVEHVLEELDADVDSDDKAELLWETITGEEDHVQNDEDVELEIKPIGIYW